MVRQFAAGRAAAAVAQRGAPGRRCALRRGRSDLHIRARRHNLASQRASRRRLRAHAPRGIPAPALTRRSFATQFGRAEVAQYLLNHGADPEAMDAKYGSTALHTASFNGHLEVAMVLLDAGANVDARNKNELTPLHYAASNGHVALARLFLERGADAYARSREGRTPLEKAEGRPEMLAVLRDALRRTQARPGAGVLIPATVRNDLRSMLAALAAGEDVDAADDDGWTALHYAASLGLLSAARLLLERGGSQAVRDHAGLTPAQVAQQAGRADVVRALTDWASLPPSSAVAAGAAAVPARFLEASAGLAAAASGPPGAAAGAHAWQQHDAHATADDGYGDDGGVDDADVSAPGEGEDEGEWVATEEDYARYAQYLEDDVEDAGAFARSAAGAAALEAARVATAAEAAAASRGDFSHGQRVAAAGAPAPKKRVAPPAQQQQAPAQAQAHAHAQQAAQQARSPQHRAAPAAAPAAPNPTQKPTAVPLTPREQQQRAVADGKAAARQAVVEGAAAAAAAAAAADGAQSAEDRAAAAATLREELTRRRVAESGHHKDGVASPGHKAGGDNGPPSAHKRRGHGKARSRPPQRGSGAVGGLFRFWATAAAAAAAALAIKAVLRPSRAPVYYYEDEEYDDEPAKAPAAPAAVAAPAGITKSK